VSRQQVRRCPECGGLDEYMVGSALVQACTTCEVVVELVPVCACRCHESIAHLRADARFLNRAHRTADWKARSGYVHPGRAVAAEASPQGGVAA
jgi:hypothetical protein